MEPWENHGRLGDFLARFLVQLVYAFQMDEAPQDFQEVVALKYVFPEVGRLKTIGVVRVSLCPPVNGDDSIGVANLESKVKKYDYNCSFKQNV